MDPHNPDLVAVVVSQQAMLLLAYLVGRVTRWLLAGRITISTSAATLTTLVGLWIGLLIAGFLFDDDRLWTVRSLSAAALVAALILTVTALVLARLQRVVPLEPIAQVARAGESESLEFKSSARWNMRTGRRDEAMENVVVKTVAAFLNSFGGTLLLGVDDAGTLIGLAPDFSTLKQPDADRYELWLRDLWRTRLGANAAVLPRLDFAPADDGEGDVCRVTVPPSPVPVYLSGPKGKGGRELWVRAGNSTQRLEVDDAIAYVTQRWPHTVRPSLRSRIGTYLLYHRRPAGASADGDRTPGGLLG